MHIALAPTADQLQLPSVQGLSFERAMRELFPLAHGKISLDPDAAPTRHEIEFAARLKNLPLGQRTAVVCPMTGMERAAPFLNAFFEQMNDGTRVLPIVTAKQSRLAEPARLAEISKFERVIVIDCSCCSTYHFIMTALSDLGLDYSKMRGLRLENVTTLHLGGDLNITSLKYDREPKSLLLSEALRLWHAGHEIGAPAPPNQGLLQALGIGLHFGCPEAALDSLGELFSPAEERAEFKASLLAHFKDPTALPPMTPMTAEIYRYDSNLANGLQPYCAAMSSYMQEHWVKFQRQMSCMPQDILDSMVSMVVEYECTRREAFAALGRRFAAIAENNPQCSRFTMSCLPCHLEGLGPDRYYERGC